GPSDLGLLSLQNEGADLRPPGGRPFFGLAVPPERKEDQFRPVRRLHRLHPFFGSDFRALYRSLSPSRSQIFLSGVYVHLGGDGAGPIPDPSCLGASGGSVRQQKGAEPDRPLASDDSALLAFYNRFLSDPGDPDVRRAGLGRLLALDGEFCLRYRLAPEAGAVHRHL